MNLLPHSIALLTGGFVFAEEGVRPTWIELFTEHSTQPVRGADVAVSPDAKQLRFVMNPGSPRVRYRLEGLDTGWQNKTDEMFFIVRFHNSNGDPISQLSFPANGVSPGWKGSVERSTFTQRREIIRPPDGTACVTLVMSSAGPANVVGVFAVSDIAFSAVSDDGKPPVALLANSRPPGTGDFIWSKSGTHPSMATTVWLGPEEARKETFVITDDDITAHADWVTTLRNLQDPLQGKSLELRWNETYSTGTGGPITAVYERLPAGSYRLRVEDLSITGESLGSGTVMAVKVPLPYWKNLRFWAACMAVTAILGTLYGRRLIRRRINRHLRHAQLIADERLRIARDLHDDLGTRLSHISLLGAYAETNSADEEARATFGQITAMSRELISALSETVWMLNPKNNKLEALVDFLCRLVSELCRLSEIRCRIDAMPSIQEVTVSHEFRHNVSLAVKEIVNNALRHSQATEIKMAILHENQQLKITVTDNGVGLTREPGKTGLGLENISQRMSAIHGTCMIAPHENGGLEITLEAPIS
ncbi:ATP-binding protein [Luteolibacter yonseiensis]|uniref:ATP-binding protein n=1 Tax=Luteolibacter yonseiensis TaxID=1144680 RepID=A0A934R093_9BACT|nr:histidine kinase [Luteolibacter yonseiensis]MBK1814112.1 ATP-binding protein [Luteolibacter yonseiensis]